MEHTLVIKKVIAGGRGLGNLADGKVAMVAGVLPGETVTVCEIRSRRGFMEAGLVRIDHPSPQRTEPPCPLYGRCGGCDLQHGLYPVQLAIKEQILHESLQRAHLELPPPEPALPSPGPFGYRSRLRLHLDPAGRLGFHRPASNEVVEVRRCLLAVEPINRVLTALHGEGWPQRLADRIAGVELLHSPEDGRLILVLQPRSDRHPPLTPEMLEPLRSLADEVVVLAKTTARGGQRAEPATLSQTFTLPGLTYRLRWDHRCFFQVNIKQNQRLIALALDLLPDGTPPSTALDLFCGMGNFSIPLALRGAAVTGVEHNHASLRWAEANSQAAGLSTCRFVAGDVDRQVASLVAKKRSFDAILLDPPRQGLGKTASLLALLAPKYILSISCDPATQARDLALMVSSGFRLRRLVPVDMFPQTHHIESVALLERN